MKLTNALTVVATLAFVPTALATGRPSSFDFEFTFPTSSTQSPVSITDEALQWYVINVSDAKDPDVLNDVVYLEFEIAGLSHTAPSDLRVELLDPVGAGIVIMDGKGGQNSINDVTMQFSDKGAAIPSTLTSGFYVQDGPGQFSDYYGAPLPQGGWRVVVTDDAAGDVGSFDSVTLRGAIPEPATLSLLALGAFAACRRRRQ